MFRLRVAYCIYYAEVKIKHRLAGNLAARVHGINGCAYLADVAEEAEVVVVIVVEVDNLEVVLHVRAVGVHRLVVGVATPRVGVRVAEACLRTGAF